MSMLNSDDAPPDGLMISYSWNLEGNDDHMNDSINVHRNFRERPSIYLVLCLHTLIQNEWKRCDESTRFPRFRGFRTSRATDWAVDCWAANRDIESSLPWPTI